MRRQGIGALPRRRQTIRG